MQLALTSVVYVMRVSVTNVEGVGYRQANQAAVQRVSGNDGQQSREKHHQVSKELQTDGQPSAEWTNTHTDLTVSHQRTENPQITSLY